MVLGLFWLNALFGNWEWTFAYHDHRGMGAFARWQNEPTPENQARWLVEKDRMDRKSQTVRHARVACGILVPLALLGIFLATRPKQGEEVQRVA